MLAKIFANGGILLCNTVQAALGIMVFGVLKGVVQSFILASIL
jgi:hypothetical protein